MVVIVLKNKWRNVKIDISLKMVLSIIPLSFSLFFILFLKTIPAIIFGIFFLCGFFYVFISAFISRINYWDIDAFINEFATATWSEPALSEAKKHNILMDFFNKKNLKYKTLKNKRDYTNLQCYETYLVEKQEVLIGITKHGFLMYSEKKNNEYLETLRKNLMSYIDEINIC